MLHIYLQKVNFFSVSLNKKYSIKILPYGKEIEKNWDLEIQHKIKYVQLLTNSKILEISKQIKAFIFINIIIIVTFNELFVI